MFGRDEEVGTLPARISQSKYPFAAILETGSKAVDEKKADILAAITSFAHKKVKLLALIAICLLPFAACRFAPPQSPRWDTQINIPLVNHTDTVQELIDKPDNLYADSRGLAHFFSESML